MNLPKDLIILVSGVTGVGKSTLARAILSHIQEFLIIEEIDLLREVVRSDIGTIVKDVLNCLWNKNYLNQQINEQELIELLNYSLLNKSTTELSYNEINEQCKFLIAPLIKICQRLKNKKIPSIIEGVNLSFESLFENCNENNYFINSNNMIYINFYLKDETEHKKRLLKRARERSESNEDLKNIKYKFENIRLNNELFHKKALEYSAKNKEFKKNDQTNLIYSIDITGHTYLHPKDNIELNVKTILNLINSNFYCHGKISS